jgi:hypothetical protein
MHQHENATIKYLFRFINYRILFLLEKSGCYKPTPLKMNLVPEIRTDRKRNMEILLSTPLPFPR